MPEQNIEILPLESLVPFENNSRTHTEEQVSQVAASISEFGFTNPILIDKDNVIIAGHCRTRAASRLGITEVPCLRLSHLTDDQKRAYVMADNRLALNAGWDLDLLKLELSDLNEADYDLSLIGFTDDELKALLIDNVEDGLTDPNDVPDVDASHVVTTPGDVWVLGRHRVMCGDSTSFEAVDELMDGHLVDLLITDPPYNVAYVGKTADALTIQNDQMDDDSFRQFLRDAFSTADSVMKPGACFYIWHADSEGYNFRGACKDVEWTVRQCLIWNKNNMVMGRQDYHWKHEPCLYGWKEGAGHLWAADRKQTTILEFDRPSRNAEHPTMKPVELIRYQMENNTKGGDIVLDLFGGSGSTLMACEQGGRIGYTMELDPKYVDVIVKRWQEFTGQKATLLADGSEFPSE